MAFSAVTPPSAPDSGRRAVALLAALVLAAAAINSGLSRFSERLRPESQELAAGTRVFDEQVGVLWPAALYRIVAFGHVPAVVDWKLIQFLGDHRLTRLDAKNRTGVYHVLDTATDLDPAFFELYAEGGNFLTVVRDDNEGARMLLEKGERFRTERLPSYPESFRAQHWRNEWRIPFTLGYVYLYELHDLPAATRAYGVLDAIPGTPAFFRKLSRHIADPIGRHEVALNVLGALHRIEKDERVREGLLKKIRVEQETLAKLRAGAGR